MSPRADYIPPLHWIHRATDIPGVFVAWCGHRVWKKGPRYPGRYRRPLGVIGDPCPREVKCRKCRKSAPLLLTLVRKPRPPEGGGSAYGEGQEE